MPNVRNSNKKQVTLWVKQEKLTQVKKLAERTGTNVSQLLQDLVSEELDLTTAEQKKKAVGRYSKRIESELTAGAKGKKG